MSNPFGWHYPAGAENDPRAPWSQDYDHEEPDDEGEFMSLCGLRFSSKSGCANHERRCRDCKFEHDCDRADLLRKELREDGGFL